MEDRRLVEWERRLKALFDEIDDELEEKYGALFPLHPARPKRGATANKEHDGLFNIGASFSAGFGTKHGRGYVLDVDMVTLDMVPADMRKMVQADVVRRIREKLPRFFPNKNLSVHRDGNMFKIVGDLSLGLSDAPEDHA